MLYTDIKKYFREKFQTAKKWSGKLFYQPEPKLITDLNLIINPDLIK